MADNLSFESENETVEGTSTRDNERSTLTNEPDTAPSSCADDMMEDEYNEDEDESEEGSGEEYNAFDAALIYDKGAGEHEFLKEDVKMAAKNFPNLERELCIPSVQIEKPVSGNLYEGTCTVALTIDVTKLPEMIRRLWELGDAMTVSVLIDNIHKDQFRTFQRRPDVLARINSDKPSKFPVGECLINVIKPLITSTYTMEENCSPREVGSFFSLLYDQLLDRFSRLTEFCMVCGSRLYAGGLLPSICDGELCQYQYQELGLLEGMSTPRVSAPVLALLMMAFSAASLSNRWKDIMKPAPSARNKERLIAEMKQLLKNLDRKWHEGGLEMKQLFNNLDRKWNEGGLDVHSNLAAVLPCPREILESSAHCREFKKATPSIAEFIEWLVISNQSYLELVPTQLNVGFFQTKHQYLFVADTPAKQAEFDALVAENGGKTRFLFHGSRTENWHSFIRTGLKNMSGTKYQLAGALHGAGIYLSNLLATSLNYCTSFTSHFVPDACITGKCCMADAYFKCGMILLAVVEVVDTPEAFHHDQDSIVVVKEKWCSIRMLVAYTGLKTPYVDLNNMTKKNRLQIQKVVHMFKTADVIERVKHA